MNASRNQFHLRQMLQDQLLPYLGTKDRRVVSLQILASDHCNLFAMFIIATCSRCSSGNFFALLICALFPPTSVFGRTMPKLHPVVDHARHFTNAPSALILG